jgi:hypothetical protein
MENSTDVTNALERTSIRCAQVLHSQTIQNNSMDMRGRTYEETKKIFRDLDPKASPHKEERFIDGKVLARSRSAFYFP